MGRVGGVVCRRWRPWSVFVVEDEGYGREAYDDVYHLVNIHNLRADLCSQTCKQRKYEV